MANIVLTDLARTYLAERKAEARKIITGGAAYTESQRAWAWAILTGQQPHFRAPQAAVAAEAPPWGFA